MNGWIWAEDGTLVNLDHVITIRIRRTERQEANEWEVVASIAGGSIRLMKGSHGECQDYLRNTAGALAVLQGVIA